ncbi:MAG: 50S ribosomal protein L25 [Candidatus Paceibacterota bacterium]|jgi:large subunit ribosomal protein L25
MLEIIAQKREILGKRLETLLDQGLVPAEIYGQGFENIHLSVPVKEFSKVFKEAGENSIVNVVIEGKTVPVLIYNVQRNPLNDSFISIDFYKVNMDKKITADIPIKFIGEAPAVKEKGGTLVKALEKIEVEALPSDLPQFIEIDLSSLIDLHQSLHIKDIKISDKIEILDELESVIVTIAEQMKEEVVEAPPVVEGAEPIEGQPQEGGQEAPATTPEQAK